MKLRVMGINEDLIKFSNLLTELEKIGIIQIVSSSRPYPNRNSIESRGYVEINILKDLKGVNKNENKGSNVSSSYITISTNQIQAK